MVFILKANFSPSSKTSGIYVHFPFCAHKCGFCDFYSGVFSYNGTYFNSIIKEIQLYQKERLIHNYIFDTLYLGGGTPSLASEKDLLTFFSFLKEIGLMQNLKEITIELNPEDVNLEKLVLYKKLGINRVSLGVQSLNATTLNILERRASLKKTVESIVLVSSEFENYSLDFMYGVPNQDLCTDLFSFSSFSPPHISTYALTLYPGTRFYLQKEHFTPLEEEALQDYEAVHEFFTQLGYEHYEISNFAKPGKQSLHNQHYWNQDHYLGLGAGASGYLGNIRYTNKQLKDYINALEQDLYPIQEKEELDSQGLFMDMLILRLRKNDKIYLADYFDKLLPEKRKRLEIFFVDMSIKDYIIYNESEKSIVPSFRTWLFSDSFTKTVHNILY